MFPNYLFFLNLVDYFSSFFFSSSSSLDTAEESVVRQPPENQGPVDDRGFPVNGDIEIRDLVARYREGLPAVLKGISVDIASGEKIGICGRTGEQAILLRETHMRRQ